MMGTVGRSIVFPDTAERGIMDSHLIRIDVNDNLVSPHFLALFFNRDELKKIIEGRGRGAIMKGLNSTIIKELTFAVPPIEEQKKIIELVNILDKKIEAEVPHINNTN